MTRMSRRGLLADTLVQQPVLLARPLQHTHVLSTRKASSDSRADPMLQSLAKLDAVAKVLSFVDVRASASLALRGAAAASSSSRWQERKCAQWNWSLGLGWHLPCAVLEAGFSLGRLG